MGSHGLQSMMALLSLMSNSAAATPVWVQGRGGRARPPTAAARGSDPQPAASSGYYESESVHDRVGVANVWTNIGLPSVGRFDALVRPRIE